MKELIRVRVQYASRQQCCETHKRPLLFFFRLILMLFLIINLYNRPFYIDLFFYIGFNNLSLDTINIWQFLHNFNVEVKWHSAQRIPLIIFTPNNLPDFITTDYNNTAENILVILDHSLAVRVTIIYALYIQFDLLLMSIILLEICRRL